MHQLDLKANVMTFRAHRSSNYNPIPKLAVKGPPVAIGKTGLFINLPLLPPHSDRHGEELFVLKDNDRIIIQKLITGDARRCSRIESQSHYFVNGSALLLRANYPVVYTQVNCRGKFSPASFG